jgi:hypothetical protein
VVVLDGRYPQASVVVSSRLKVSVLVAAASSSTSPCVETMIGMSSEKVVVMWPVLKRSKFSPTMRQDLISTPAAIKASAMMLAATMAVFHGNCRLAFMRFGEICRSQI